MPGFPLRREPISLEILFDLSVSVQCQGQRLSLIPQVPLSVHVQGQRGRRMILFAAQKNFRAAEVRFQPVRFGTGRNGPAYRAVSISEEMNMQNSNTSDGVSVGRNTGSAPEWDGADLIQERQQHQEHLRRLKKYKKKKKQQIIGLVLECVLLCVVIVAYAGVTFMQNTINKITIKPVELTTTQAPVTLPIGPNPTSPGETGYVPGPTSPSESVTAPSGNGTEPSGSVTDPTEPPTEPYTNPIPSRVPERTGYYTIACFGVDSRDTTTLLNDTQGDVIIIVSINKQTGIISMVSVYRDFFFEIETDKYLKITDAYARYGAQAVMEALNRNLDLQISDFVVVNWTSLADVVDLLGGLDVNMTLEEATAVGYYIHETRLATGREYRVEGPEPKEGIQHLDGVNVVCFCRIRYGVGDDYGRTQCQRMIIGQIMDKAKSADVWKLIKIVEKVTDNIRTTLDIGELRVLLSGAGSYNTTGVRGEFIYSSDYVEDVKLVHQTLYDDYDYEPTQNVHRIAEWHDYGRRGLYTR